MSIQNFFKSLFSTSTGRLRSRSRLPRRSSYRPALEELEARVVPARLLLLDFDGATLGEVQYVSQSLDNPTFTPYPDVEMLSFVGEVAALQTQFGGYDRYRWLDLNNDGVLNRTDGDLVVNRILARVQEDFLGNDLIIQREDNSNLAVNRLYNGINGDCFLFVAGNHTPFYNLAGQEPLDGQAPGDLGNSQDDWGKAGSSVTTAQWIAGAGLTGDAALTGFVNMVSNVISHEAGHTFGLGHIDRVLHPEAYDFDMMHPAGSGPVNKRFRDITYADEGLERYGIVSQNARRELFANLGTRDPIYLNSGVLTIFGDTNVNSVDDVITVNLNPLSPIGTVTVNGDWRLVVRSAFNSIVIYAGDGYDTINLEHTNGKPVTVFGMEDSDTVQLSPTARNLGNVNSNITIWGGGGGSNSVHLFDNNNTAAVTYSVTDTTVQISGRPGFSVLARESASLALHAGSSSTATVNVFRTSIATRVSRAAIVNVGSSSSGLEDIRGRLTIDNPPRHTALTLNDTASNLARTNVNVNFGLVSGLSPAIITYTENDLSSLTILGNGLGNTFFVQDTPQNALGTVQTRIDSGSGIDTVVVRGTTGPLTVNGGAEADTVNILATTGRVTVNGGAGADTVNVLGTTGPLTVNGGAEADTINVFATTGSVTVNSGAGANTVNVFGTTGPLTVNGGAEADTVNVFATTGSVTVNGGAGADTVNVGKNGSVQSIAGPLTVTNFGAYTVLNLDDSADTTARTVTMSVGTVYGTISGLAPGLISYRKRDIPFLNVSGGSGGNTFTINDTTLSTSPGGTLTSVNTGTGSDQVFVRGTTGSLLVQGQEGTNAFTVGSPTAGLNAINGTIFVSGLDMSNTLSVIDGASTTGQDYLLARDFVQRLDKARISYQNLNSLTLQTGAQTDQVRVQDTMPEVGFSSSTRINNGGGNDRINVSRTTGTLWVTALNSSVIEVGNAQSSPDNIQGRIIVEPSGAGNSITLNLNDQAATAPQQLDVTGNALGTSFLRSGAAQIVVFFSPLRSFQWTGGSGNDTINVKARPAAGSIFMLGSGDDLLNVGTAADELFDSSILNVIGGEGTDQLLIRDQGRTTPRRYDLAVSQAVGSESLGALSARQLNSFSNVMNVRFDHVESVTLNAGSGGNFFKITGTPTATSLLINAGAGNDAVDVGSNAIYGGDSDDPILLKPADSLVDIRGPLTINGQDGLDQVTFNDQGTTTRQNYTLEADQLTRTDAASVANMAPISFTALEAIALNGSSGGSTVFVGSTAAGTSASIYGHPAAPDTFTVGFAANTDAILGPVTFFGQAADNDFAYYYDYFGSSPRSYNVSTDPLFPRSLLVERAGVAPVTFDDLSQVIFFTPLIGGSTVNIKAVPARMFLNMGVGNGDIVTLGSLAPNRGGTLANIRGPVAVESYSTASAVTLVLDDSGNADLTPKSVVLTPRSGPFDYGNHIEGFAPSTVFWNLGVNASVALLGGAADETFALTSTAFAAAISIDGGEGVNALDYSAIAGVPASVSFYRGEGDAADSAGGNHGTINGDVTFVPGRVGQAFDFDGDLDYVDLGSDASLDLPGSMSVSMWVRLDTLDHAKYFLADFYPASGNTSQGSLGTVADASTFAWFQAYTDGTFETLSGTTPIQLNQWFHLAAVRDDNGKTVRLYVNGVEESSLSYAGKTVVSLQGSKILGGSIPSFPADFIDGQLDEVGIYNRALSSAEIQALASAGSGGNSSGVVVNLPLGTASGLTGGIARIQNVIGSAANDILVGNGGNVLSGGAGRDLLIAGALAGILNGGDDEDLLIGGTTDYDANAAALLAIMAEWSRTDADYATRVANLENGTNGAPIFNATTVHSNGGGNTLTGNAGLDFFFANLDLDTLDRDPLTEDLVEL